jgi:hypothetical protein
LHNCQPDDGVTAIVARGLQARTTMPALK